MSNDGSETRSVSQYDDNDNIRDAEKSGSEYEDEASPSESEQNVDSPHTKRKARSKDREGYSRPIATQTLKSLRGTYSEAYRELYNETIEEITNPFVTAHDFIPGSQIGAALWEPTEKEILFQKLTTLGRDNIEGIAAAIRTKSEAEVRQYILLLVQGLVEGNVTLTLPLFSAADIPAAFEVSKQSEDALEGYAAGLSHYQQKSDQRREKKKHGDCWLLTEDIAEDIEAEIRTRGEGPEEGFESQDEHPGQNDQRPEQEETRQSQSKDEISVPAAELLHLPTWLRLSQLFMYQGADSTENWTNFITSPDETPSMYHTTFQDFHNLTVSLTRRLIQASTFQAMTRLRARDKDQPSAAVGAIDVRTAVDMLNLKKDRRKFWGLLPRRHGLRVYKRDHKYEKGATKSGVKLSLEEAEEFLGVGSMSEPTREDALEEVMDTVEDEDDDGEDVLDPDQFYEDSELWTEPSENGDEQPAHEMTISNDQASIDSDDGEDPVYHPTTDDDDEEAEETVRRKRRRKGQAERAFQKAHDAYLEAFDREVGRVEEVKLWDKLKVAPPKDIKNEEIEVLRQPVIRRDLSHLVNWRDGIGYRAEWERESGSVKPEEFVKMQERGERGRKRRRTAYEYLEREGKVVLNRPETSTVMLKKRLRGPTDVASERPRSLSLSSRATSVGNSAWRSPGESPMPLAEAKKKDSDHLAAILAKRLAKKEEEKRKEEEIRREAEEEEKRVVEERLVEEKKTEDKRRKKEEREARKRAKEEEKRADEAAGTKRATRSRKTGF